ncbi:MAG TPA: hypothetical protein VFT46_06200 [Holophagaceae bacterium]|nr:hypothetical protein [Holophagaceae bacterium]
MNQPLDESFTSYYDKEDFKKSSDVSSRLALHQIYLAHSELKMFNSIRKIAGTEMALQASIESGFAHEEKSEFISSVLKLILKGILDSDSQELPKGTEVIEIQCTFALEGQLLRPYESTEEKIEHLKCFSTIGAALAMWPFLREFIFSQSARTGLNALVLPYIKVHAREMPKS